MILYQVLAKIQGENFVLGQEALSLLFPPSEVRCNFPGSSPVSGQRRSVSLLLQKGWYRYISQSILHLKHKELRPDRKELILGPSLFSVSVPESLYGLKEIRSNFF